jgi:hypothetical protein
MAIIAGCEANLKSSLNIIEKVLQEYNMKINKKKTKVVVCGREKTVTSI